MKHVIIGNGLAGVVAAETLRKRRPNDAIVMIGDEPHPSYSRMAIPYLLIGNIDERGTYLRKDTEHFAAQRIQTVIGRVNTIDTAAKRVVLTDGQSVVGGEEDPGVVRLTAGLERLKDAADLGVEVGDQRVVFASLGLGCPIGPWVGSQSFVA